MRRPTVLSQASEAMDPASEQFRNEHYMEAWADERDRWIAAGQTDWHTGVFWGDVELAWEAQPASLSSPAETREAGSKACRAGS